VCRVRNVGAVIQNQTSLSRSLICWPAGSVAVTILDLTLDLIGDGVRMGKSATEGDGRMRQ